MIIVLHRHDANRRERFAETRTGLDHVGFGVPSRADLEAWQAHLQELGVVQSPIADTPYGSILVFRDPDNIQLEMSECLRYFDICEPLSESAVRMGVLRAVEGAGGWPDVRRKALSLGRFAT